MLRSLVLVLVTALGLLTGCARETDLPPPTPRTDSSTTRSEQGQATLDRLRTALDGGSREDAVALAAPPGRDLLGWVHDNAQALRLSDVSFRYVDEGPELDATQRATYGPDAWIGTVDTTYRLDGFDREPSRVETQVVFVPDGRSARIAATGGAGVRTPLWLQDRLAVVRTGRTLLMVAGDRAGRFPPLVGRAVSQVQRVLTDWRGPLVVEVPRTGDELEQALQAERGKYANIAAVTTTEDGSLAPGSPVRVFVNPAVFGRLKQRGAQVVMTHEATHAAADAPFASMPTWLLEGFADYVALRDAGVPVSTAAGQILGRIRQDGLPRDLPSSADLDPSAAGLGATYEEAWLACRYLAEQYGGDRLLAFYRAVDRGASAPEAFRSVLGTTQGAFVAGWRRDLAGLAGVAGGGA